jgi:hypothetical protein
MTDIYDRIASIEELEFQPLTYKYLGNFLIAAASLTTYNRITALRTTISSASKVHVSHNGVIEADHVRA